MEERMPYEPPKITEIDVGNLLDEAGSAAHSAQARFENVKSLLEGLQASVLHIESELELALKELDDAKARLLKFDTVARMMRDAGQAV